MRTCDKGHQMIVYHDEVGCPLCSALDAAEKLGDQVHLQAQQLRIADAKVTEMTRMLNEQAGL